MRKKFEIVIQLLIFYSIGTYLIELEYFRYEHTLDGHPFFLWSERFVALVFTIEYITRWYLAKSKIKYPFTFAAIIDLIAILPFYIGFFVDMRCLRLIRSLRLLRIFKFHRYSVVLGHFITSLKKVKSELIAIGSMLFVLIFISSVLMYEIERIYQPDKFDSLDDGFWWCIVTLSTIGYGDIFPISIPGRIIAVITSFLGLGLFATFVGLISTSFNLTLQEEKEKEKQTSPDFTL